MRGRYPFRRRPRPIPNPRFWPEQRRPMGFFASVRPFVFGGILLSIWPTLDPALVEPPRFLSSDPERVSESFGRCGRGRSHACVVDGDTFRIGQRRVRIIGIDAPEVKARCPKEAQLAEQASVKLQGLLNQGPFEMTGRFDDMQDRYGRDLRTIERKRPDGSRQSIAEEMRNSGLAHRYAGFKTSWC